MSRAYRRETVRLRVPFHDCDPMSIVWHGNYLKYFEHARMALFHACKLDVPAIRDLGYKMVVADTRIRFTHPSSFGDELEVSARTVATEPLLKIVYSVQNLTRDRRSARGNTVLALTRFDDTLVRGTPPEIEERLHG